MTTRKIFYILFVLIFMFCTTSFAQTKLAELIDIAKSNNPEIMAAKNAWEAEKVRTIKYYFLEDPKIGLDYEKIPPGTSLNIAGAAMKTPSISQMIPFPLKIYFEGRAQTSKSNMYYQIYLAKEREIIKNLKTLFIAPIFNVATAL